MAGRHAVGAPLADPGELAALVLASAARGNLAVP